MTAAVDIRGLVKRYDGRAVLDGLDLDVPAGSIFGFLGPNGSGKTTTIRALLGLVRADAGELRILGKRVPAGLVGLRGRVGAVVDRPALYPPLSGRRNLEVVAGMLGGRGQDRIEELLALVGLDDAAGRAVSAYSYGMRQRLALAAALLPRPALLVLDEPATGLDPAGRRQLREVFRGIRATGATLFISSHLLAEVELTCDRVAILDRGRIVEEGDTAALLQGPGCWNVGIGDADPAAARAALAAAGLTVVDGVALCVETEAPAEITRALAGAGIWLEELRPARRRLEELFLQLTEPQAPPWQPTYAEAPAGPASWTPPESPA